MEAKAVTLALVLLALNYLPHTCGQLSTSEKQSLLDQHNAIRASVGGANVVQTVSP